MEKRERKIVPPATAYDWLERYEAGASISELASATPFKVRTVRERIEWARRERREEQAQRTFLLNALESHHQDLCNAADSLRECLKLTDELRWPNLDAYRRERDSLIARRGLGRHLSSSSRSEAAKLWKRDDPWESACDEYTRAQQALVEKLKETFGTEAAQIIDSVLLPQARGEEPDIGAGYEAALEEEALKKKHDEALEWPEFGNLSDSYGELRELRGKLTEELESLALKRVVPGRCKLCPF